MLLLVDWRVLLRLPRPIPDVVAPEGVLVAYVEAAVGNDWISPGFLHLVGRSGSIRRRKAPLLTIFFRVSLNQEESAIFAVKIESSIGVTNRSRSGDAFRPFYLAGLEIGANEGLSSTAIKVVANQDCTSDRAWELGVKIDFLSLKGSLVVAELNCPTADTASAAVDQPVSRNGRKNTHPHCTLGLSITP